MVDSNVYLKTSLGEIFLSSEWSSLQENYRKKIRTELYKKTKNADLLNLNKSLKSDDFFVSISHCRSLGGYALHLKKNIGFDVEEVSRIKPEIIKRVSTEKDLNLFGNKNSYFIWVVKEAAFKFMSSKGDVMTGIQIKTLDKVDEQSYFGTLLVKETRAEFLCGKIGENCVFSLVSC